MHFPCYKGFFARVMFYTSNNELGGFGMINPGFSGSFYDWYKEGVDACRDAI